jgi:hypothetical protein
VAVDDQGQAFASSNPAGGSWSARPIDPVPLTAVSCLPAGVCVAVDERGDAIASQNATASFPTWSLTQVDGGRLSAVSCAASGLCVGVDESGVASASDDPAAPLPSWSQAAADPGAALSGVSCLPGGSCVAVDRQGRSVLARVPPPKATTTTPSEVTVATATLAGVVNPNDAELSDCHFEYGTTLPYAQSIPCSAVPVPAGGYQLVGAHLSGLAPNVTYHYRVVASSAVGTGVGEDAMFTTAVSSQVPLVHPHPSISGTPAVRQRLACHPGVSSEAAALTYAWLRDLIPIPGARSTTYTVKDVDTGHHLQCQVTATNGGGSVTARSAFVTIPVQGIPASAGETVVGRARFSNGKVSVPVLCSPHAFSGCQVVLRLTVVETLRGRRVVAIGARSDAHSARTVSVTLGAVRARLARGEHRVVTVVLNRVGRRLVAARRRLTAALAASGTVIGVIESSLGRQLVVLGARSRGASRHVLTHHR